MIFFFYYEEQKLLFVVQSLSHVQLFVIPWTAPSPSLGSCSNSCPLSWWCHLTIMSSIVPFSSCLQSFPASGSFLMSQFFTSGGQSIGASASASVLPINIQDGFPLVFLKSILKDEFFPLGKTIFSTAQNFVGKVMSLLFNMLSRLVVAFLPRSQSLFIPCLQSPSAVILEPKKLMSITVSFVSPSICQEVLGPDAMILVFFDCWVLSQLFHSPLSLSSRGSLVPLHFLP